MTRAQGSIIIHRSARDVWDFMTDLSNTPRWDIGVEETRILSPGPIGIDTSFQNVGAFLGKPTVREYRITSFEPYRKATVTLAAPVGNLKRAEVSYILEPLNEGTRLTSSGWVEFEGFFRFLEPLIVLVAKRDIRGDLANVKRILETSE